MSLAELAATVNRPKASEGRILRIVGQPTKSVEMGPREDAPKMMQTAFCK